MSKPLRTVTQHKRTCDTCQKKFRAKRRDSRHCSAACRQRAHRAREGLDDLDREIEAARLRYWELIYQKARALGRAPSQIVTAESQYVDSDGNVWLGGVLGDGGPWRRAGKTTPPREGWHTIGTEAAGPPWAPPGPPNGFYEKDIIGRQPNPENINSRKP
jgi:hypothetical protein